MTTPTLERAVRFAFAKGGPVETVMGQYRPIQEEAAIGLSKNVEQYTNSPNVGIMLQQQQAGIGKTTEIGVNAGLMKLLTGRTSVISTFTRAMRLSYRNEAAHINEIVRLTLTGLGVEHLYRPLIISDYTSLTSYFSPSKIDALKARIAQKTIDKAPYEAMLRYYDGARANGDVPNFAEYSEDGELPVNTTSLNWCMCPSDKGHPLWEEVTAHNVEARDADIVLVTHAMLTRSNRARGTILRTRNGSDEEAPTGVLVVDEAEKLPEVAYDAVTTTVTLKDILDIVGEARALYSPPRTKEGQQAVSDALAGTDAGIAVLSAWMEGHMPPRSIVINPNDANERPDWVPLKDALQSVADGLKSLHDVAIGRYHDADRDILMADRLRHLRQNISALANFVANTWPKLELRTFVNPYSETDLRMAVNLGLGRNLINVLWEEHQSGEPIHSFCGVIFLSATLTDLPPNVGRYEWFKKNIGFDNGKDKANEMEPLPKKGRYSHGKIPMVIVPSRDWPVPTLATNLPSMINPDFVDCGSNSIVSLAAMQAVMSPETRILVLFPSFDLAKHFHEMVLSKAPALNDRIIRREPNSNIFASITKFAKTPHAIWFGVEWEGVNFVDPDPPKGQLPRTLADIVVLARIPQPPTNEIRRARTSDGLRSRGLDEVTADRKAEGIALWDATGRAYRKLIQGIGRGLRNANDVIQMLVILDVRFPVPHHIADTRKIARSGGDTTKQFGRFDTILEPYSVRKWSQIDKTGIITPVIK